MFPTTHVFILEKDLDYLGMIMCNSYEDLESFVFYLCFWHYWKESLKVQVNKYTKEK